MNHPNSLVVIPTYNEQENIENLVHGVFDKALPGTEILIIDDNSPDGTGELLDKLTAKDKRVHVIHRPSKAGLGSAYRDGFRWGIERGYDAFYQMDADLSHNPDYLPGFQKLINSGDAEVIVGSRYIDGGGIRNWSLTRRIISKFGSFYARFWLGAIIHDMTGGFNGWRAEVLKNIQYEQMQSEGYCFLIEIKFKAYAAGYRIKEYPIIFTERRTGKSKISKRIIWEAAWRTPSLKLKQIWAGQSSVK